MIFPLAEVCQMYDTPRPYGQDLREGKTCEQYVQHVYLDQGFEQESREGVDYLINARGGGYS
ncbi:hypothetical protein [Hymenobacter wooponensis]|uniref:hypothetical protein n=1 Tax=Hymenobacter wooponensis TaxID=1525360 RepID=UPI0010806E65|nr:hypothetical protein [Hymenobacter wooponensis]